MIYVTGDIHGDISRFSDRTLRKLKKNDYLIVCGDFGFIWDGSAREKRLLKRLGRRRYHILFVEGRHENHRLLSEYPQREWNGGTVREISGKLLQLCRGYIFEIDGKSIFAFGGGESADSEERSGVEDSWELELPSPGELDSARENLKKRGMAVDFIVTHQPSGRIRSMLSDSREEPGVLDMFLDEVRSSCKYAKWFFGSLHRDLHIPPLEVSLFESFAEMRENCVLMGGKRRRVRRHTNRK